MSTQSLPLPDAARRQALIWLVLGGAGLAWGATQPLSKVAVSTGHNAVGLVFWQCLIGILALGLVMALTGRRLPRSRPFLIFYGVCAFLGTALPHSLSFTALAHVPAGIASILMASVPLATLFLSIPLGIDRPGPRRLLGLALGAASVLLVLGPEASLPEPGQAAWAALYLVVVFSYAVENVYIAKYQPEGTDPVQTMMGLFAGAFLMVLPVVAIANTWVLPESFGAPEAALIGASLLHVAAYMGFVWLIGAAGPVFAAQVGYVVTLAGVFLGILFLGESHSGWIWAALVLMLAGVSLVRPKGT
ncbi:MAG: DMT family transporter [Pseudomonadota bacterium]